MEGPLLRDGAGRRVLVLRVGIAAVLCALIVAALLAALHSLAILPLAEEVIAITNVQHQEGLNYYAALPPDPYVVPRLRAERLYEGDRPSPFPMVPGYGVIATSGQGRFTITGNTLFFSATDNSDPRTNGRTYTLRRPLSLPPPLLAGLWAAALLAAAALVWLYPHAVTLLLTRPPFVLAAALLVAFAIANRLWLFVDYPIPAIHPDSASYYVLTEQLQNGEWPNFARRPPVYPVFIGLVFSIVDRITFLTAVQTILSTAAALTLVYALYRWRRWLALPAAVGMAGYLVATSTIEHDTGMLSESLYSTLLVFSFAALLLGLRGVGRAGWMAASSAGMGLAILTRPAGMFLIVTFLLVVAFAAWNRFGRRALLAFALPMPVLLLAMCIYNQRTLDVFAISAWGEANLAVGTFTYWEPDPAYPPDINEGIGQIKAFVATRMTETSVDPAILAASWDPTELSRAFVLGFHGHALDIAMRMGDGNYEKSGRAWIRRISFDSIGKHPDVYAKFVFAMLYNYFRPWPEDDFRSYVVNRVQALYVERRFSKAQNNPVLTRMAREFADGTPPAGVVLTNADPAAPVPLGDRILLAATPASRLYDLTYSLRTSLFTRWLWRVLALVTLCVSTVLVVTSRGRSTAAFAAFIVTVSMLGASLVISLVEYSQPRYSYPMEWTYFVAPLLLLMLVAERRSSATPTVANA